MAKDWGPLQDEIRDLYHIRGKPLKEVMRLIKGRHNFVASERAYRTQLRKWRYMKYNTQNTPNQRPRPAPRPVSRHQPRTLDASSGGNSASSMTAFHSGSEVLSFDALANDRNVSSSNSGYVDFSHNLDPGIPFTFTTSNDDPEGKTALHHAVIDENLDQARSLLHNGAAVDTKDFAGNPPLHYGVIVGNLDLVQLLLRFGADPNIRGPLGRTPLHQAASMSALEIAEALLKNGGKVSELDENGDTPLHLALRQPSTGSDVPPLVSRFTQAGADVNLANKQGLTPFHILLDQPISDLYKYRHVRAAIMALLRHGADISVAFPDGRTTVQVFLKRPGDRWASSTSSRYEVSTSDATIMTELLDRSGTSDHTVSSGEPLPHFFLRDMYQTWDVSPRWVKRLLELANPHTTAKNGNSLLHELMLKPNAATEAQVVELVRRGWDPEHRNHRGQTPLHSLFQVAETAKNSALIESLLVMMVKFKIDLWVCDSAGTSVLYGAAARFMKWNPRIVRTLFRSDMSHEKSDTVGWPGWELARLAETFAEARQHIFDSPTILPQNLDSRVRKEACAALAESYLSGVTEKFLFEPNEKQQCRGYMAGILKDCRSHDVDIDMRFYDEVLELC